MNKQDIAETVGVIAMGFSSIEFALQNILAKLIDPSPDSIAGSMFIDRFDLSTTLTKVRAIARFRYAHDDATLSRIESLCKRIEQLRPERNLLIHGLWQLSSQKLAQGEIPCLDMRWRADKSKKHWSRAKERIFTLDDLRKMSADVGGLASEALALAKQMTPEQMMPMVADGTQQSKAI